MNIFEVDFRYPMVKGIFDTLSEELQALETEILHSEYVFDSEFIVEQAEWVLGIAFITAQTYITGTVADINLSMKGEEKLTKRQLLKRFNHNIEGTNLTQLQLCDAIANYFKHHDEWESWEPTFKNKRTLLPLAEMGINQKSSFPCYQVASKLWSEDHITDLSNLLEILVEWRKNIFNSLLE